MDRILELLQDSGMCGDVSRYCVGQLLLGWGAKAWPSKAHAVVYWTVSRDSVALTSLRKLPLMCKLARQLRKQARHDDVAWLCRLFQKSDRTFSHNVASAWMSPWPDNVTRAEQLDFYETAHACEPRWFIKKLYANREHYLDPSDSDCDDLSERYREVLARIAETVQRRYNGRYLNAYVRELASSCVFVVS